MNNLLWMQIDTADNVAVALRDLPQGTEFARNGRLYRIGQPVGRGHKFALESIGQGADIVKYGYPIGLAAEPIAAGDWVHTHNVQTKLGELLEYEYKPDASIAALQASLGVEPGTRAGSAAAGCSGAHNGLGRAADGGDQSATSLGAFGHSGADHATSPADGDRCVTGSTPGLGDGDRSESALTASPNADHVPSSALFFPAPATFMGYERTDGQVGIRNELWIVNTVGCVNKTAELLAREASARYAGFVDGVYHFPHPYGCSQLGEDHEHTRRILAGLVRHPNAAGVLVLGLGCENNHIAGFRELIGDVDPAKVRYLAVQEVEDERETGLRLLGELAEYACTFRRVPCPVSKLVVGLKCGGSDAFSGITANPLLGKFSDLLVRSGGASILTEVPEMFGAETILMNRCIHEAVFEDTVHLINDFKNYYTRHGQVIYENPSPGNKQGGITTLEEKSLGCTQKGGTSPVVGVVPYGRQVQGSGLHLLQGPGNDIVAVTALTAAGAQIILFTTGRGTPLGGPVPTVKVSSNSELAERKRGWIDWNAGKLLEGTSLPDMADELYRYILDVAEGNKLTANERNGYREIAIFKDGVTL